MCMYEESARPSCSDHQAGHTDLARSGRSYRMLSISIARLARARRRYSPRGSTMLLLVCTIMFGSDRTSLLNSSGRFFFEFLPKATRAGDEIQKNKKQWPYHVAAFSSCFEMFFSRRRKKRRRERKRKRLTKRKAIWVRENFEKKSRTAGYDPTTAAPSKNESHRW